MQVNKKFIIDAEFANTRIDKWLKLQTKKFPQSFIEKLLRSGKVKINNKKIKSSYKLQLNDEAIVQFTYEEKKENEKFSSNLFRIDIGGLSIVFENQDFYFNNVSETFSTIRN